MSSARFMARRPWTSTTHAKPLERKLARRSWRPSDSHNPRLNLQSRNAFFFQPHHEQQVDTNMNLDALLSPRALNNSKVDALLSKPRDIDVSGNPGVASVLAGMNAFVERKSDHIAQQGSAKLDEFLSDCSKASVLASMNMCAEQENARRATVGDHVVIKDTERTRKRFTEGIGKVFAITMDDQAFLPYRCEGSTAWLREDDVKLWQADPLLNGQGSCSALEVGRPTVGDRVLIKDTPRTRKQFTERIGQVCVIRTDDQAFLPYQCEGSSVWLREEDVKIQKALV